MMFTLNNFYPSYGLKSQCKVGNESEKLINMIRSMKVANYLNGKKRRKLVLDT